MVRVGDSGGNRWWGYEWWVSGIWVVGVGVGQS